MDHSVKSLLMEAHGDIAATAREWQLQNDIHAHSVEELDAYMHEVLSVMRDSAVKGMQKDLRSVSGLTGGKPGVYQIHHDRCQVDPGKIADKIDSGT